MGNSTPLEIKVIYDSSSGRRRTSLAPVTRTRRTGRVTAVLSLGVLNLLVAASAYYVTWWKVDPFINVTLIMRTPLPGVNITDVSKLIVPESRARDAVPPLSPIPAESGRQATPTFSPTTAQILLGITKYSWLTLTTLSACAIASTAGALLSHANMNTLRRVGLILFLGGAVGLVYAAWSTWSEYGRQFPTRTLRLGMGGLVIWAATLGMILSLRARLLSRAASVTTLVAAFGTVAALYLGHLAGAIPHEQSTPQFLLAAFAIHSAWGWLMWPMTSRWVT